MASFYYLWKSCSQWDITVSLLIRWTHARESAILNLDAGDISFLLFWLLLSVWSGCILNVPTSVLKKVHEINKDKSWVYFLIDHLIG